MLGLILLNGLFAMSEIAIVTAKRTRLSAMAAGGRRSAQAALALAENPTQFLSTVQIGITSIGIMSGIWGESVLAAPFADWLESIGVPLSYSDNLATGLVVVTVTYLSIVLGELIPKRIGQVSAETIACIMSRPMQALAVAVKPFVVVLSHSTNLAMRLLRQDRSHGDNVTEEDIHALLDEGSTTGIIDQQEHRIVKNVLRLEDRSVSTLMVPRNDIVFLDTELSTEENFRKAVASPHSRFPVCTKSIDNMLGVINAKELLAAALTAQAIDFADLMKPCHMVPQSLTAMDLLEFFRTGHCQMVFVVDEYGDIKGLVTLQNLMEALTGEFVTPGSEHDLYIVQRQDGSYLLDGLLSLIEVKDCLGLSPLADEDQYETLSGLIMTRLARIPTTGDCLEVQGWLLEIVDMDGHRIDKVLASLNRDNDHGSE